MKSINYDLRHLTSRGVYDYGYFWVKSNRNRQKPQAIHYVDKLPDDIRADWFLYYTQQELL